MQEKGKLPSLWLQGQLRIRHPPDKLRSWEDTDVLLKLWSWKKKNQPKNPNKTTKKKNHPKNQTNTLQGVCFAFSAPLCQKSNVTTQPTDAPPC